MDSTGMLIYLLQHAASAMHRRSDQVLQERLGIGMSQFRLLIMLQKRPHMQQKALADSLGQTEASISRQIKLLGERGLIAIEINPANRREHIAVSTAKGIKITEAAQEVVIACHQPVFSHLNDKQKTQLLGLLQSVHNEVCQPGKTRNCDNPFER